MSEKITERSLYAPILKLFEEVGKRFGVDVAGIQEVSTDRKYPDILIQMNGHKILIQIKIDKVSRLIEDIVSSYPTAKKLGADLVGLLFPSEVRSIAPAALNDIVPRLRVDRALVLTQWLSADLGGVELQRIVERIVESFIDYRKTLRPIIDYMTVAYIARETIEDLANALRGYMGVKKYFDMVQAVVGRFDFYRSLLEEFIENEEVMKSYLADIVAYLVVLQLLFSHIVSVKKYKKDVLPDIANPFAIPDNLIDDIKNRLESTRIYEEYKDIVGSLPYILDILREVSSQSKIALIALGRYIYALKVLRPEHVKEELLGRIYQEGLPPETRKNLGAFFTKPKAAKLLAELAVDRWDEKVLDPACGSGTLLVGAYWAKMKRAEEEEVSLDRDRLHEIFVEKHIVGIDIMQFAKELATINLALQNVHSNVAPKIYYGNGITKMMQAVGVQEDDPPFSKTLMDFVKLAEERYRELSLPREGFDLVIMNPPFTRRERIPKKEREQLDKLLGEVVRGKVGYWAYFFVAADNVIKLGGKLAAVTPEEFFAGRSAESVRRYLLQGEVFNEENKMYEKKYSRVYTPRIVIRSGVEIAFSEGAHYRDYLAVFEKRDRSGSEEMIFVVLKKKLDELTDKELEEIVNQIRDFYNSSERSLSSELMDARKISNISLLISKHIGNLKPLVGMNNIETQELILELLEALAANPTLDDYERNGFLQIRDYNPGQYITRGVEEYARRLFASKYEGRGKISFEYVKEINNSIDLKVRAKGAQIIIKITRSDCVYSLRSPAGVKHIDVTGEEECAIINPQSIPSDVLRLTGFVNIRDLIEAANDIKQAYNDLAGNMLIVRRARITSPNIYWLAFFSDNKIIGPSAPMICVKAKTLEKDQMKLLTLYLNSTIALAQLLGFAVETEGAWIALQGDQVWSHIHIPDVVNMSSEEKGLALTVWQEVRKIDVGSLYHRIQQKDPIQKKIDELALRMLGLDNWIPRLDKIYAAILRELDSMQKILDKPSNQSQTVSRRKNEKKKKEEKSPGIPLEKWSKPKG